VVKDLNNLRRLRQWWPFVLGVRPRKRQGFFEPEATSASGVAGVRLFFLTDTAHAVRRRARVAFSDRERDY
jgi:hypothetical protein